MFENEKILKKIEKLVEQLPYKQVKIEIEIEIEIDGQLLILEKQKKGKIGFI